MDGGHRWPIVVGRVEVVPRHLVDAHCHHRLDAGVETLRHEAAGGQFIEVEDGRMGEVENQWMPKRLVPLVQRRIIADEREEPVVEFAGLVKVTADLGPLRRHWIGGRRIGVKYDGSGRDDRS